MLKSLHLKGVGPAPEFQVEFGARLNVITGDNGLGKSFLLDTAFWAMTRRWPGEVNSRLTSSRRVLPRPHEEGEISFEFTSKTGVESYRSRYAPRDQAWTGRPGRPANPGLVLYAMADGGFSVWDPARNYWRTQAGSADVQERRPAYVFSAAEVWDGLLDDHGTPLCNGLIRDLATWQRENGEEWTYFAHVLTSLSSTDEEMLLMGELTRISLDDARDMPTLRMPYGQEVLVVHASAGMRRVLALAYLLVWAWSEHRAASRLLHEGESGQMVFLIDEIESHLHPKWQFSIVRSLLSVMEQIAPATQVQLITATHSPQVLASLESFFDDRQDAWLDLDYAHAEDGSDVLLTRRPFEKHGTVSNWLTSEAFNLSSDRSPDMADLLKRAAELISQQQPDSQSLAAMHADLCANLNPQDTFLFRWRAQAERKGWQSGQQP